MRFIDPVLSRLTSVLASTPVERAAFLRRLRTSRPAVSLLAAAVSAFCVVAVPPSAHAADAQTPEIVFAAGSIRASGITPGAEVVWFGRSVVYQGGIPRLTRHFETVRDDDRDGVVTWKIDVPELSVWTVIDFSNGAFAVASAPGFELRTIDLPRVVWRGGTTHVDLSRDHLDFLLVRPRVGVWTLRAFEGGRLDADGRRDATLRGQLAMMRAAEGSAPPPPTATPRDVLVIIDPRALDVFARSAE